VGERKFAPCGSGVGQHVGRAGDRCGGFLDAGDQVLVTVFYSARGRGSGIEYEERLFDVYSFRDGQCVRKREFRQRSDAVEAAGLDH
jgi:ketosteroid isomerase-like protein